MMRLAQASWSRVGFLNPFLAGTWSRSIQMDFLPALACGAHLLLLARRGAADRGRPDRRPAAPCSASG